MPGREVGLGAPLLPARSMCPGQAAYPCRPRPPVDGSPVLRVRWAALTPERPSASCRCAGVRLPARPGGGARYAIAAPASVGVGVAPAVAHDPSALRSLL